MVVDVVVLEMELLRVGAGIAVGGAMGGKFAHRVVMSALCDCRTEEKSYKFSGIKLDDKVAKK